MNKGFLPGSLLLLLLVAGCTDSSLATADTGEGQNSRHAIREVDWVDLLPDDDLAALEDRPALLDSIEEGSDADTMANSLDGQLSSDISMEESARLQRYQAALTSTRTRQELDGTRIRIPGFVVPINFDDQQRVTEFFLVPFFGACIHVPPPPPNQIIYAQVDDAFVLESIFDPVWLEGTLHLQKNDNGLGQSAYALTVEKREAYYQ